MPRKSKKSTPATPAEHLRQLQWMWEKGAKYGIKLTPQQWETYQRLKREVEFEQQPEARRPYSDA